MLTGVAKVREEAGISMAHYCRDLGAFELKKRLMKQIYDTFVKEKPTRRKITFLKFAEVSLKVFSREALQFFIIPQLLSLSHTEDLGLRLELIRLFPDINDAIIESNSQLQKKLSKANKEMEKIKNKRIKEKLRASAKQTIVRLRSKAHQSGVAKMYKENFAREEGALLAEGIESSLIEIFEKEAKSLSKKNVNFCFKRERSKAYYTE